jgi:hypothetical protein
MSSWQATYPAVHRALAPEYRDLPEHGAEALVRGAFGEDFTLADAESFFGDIGSALSSAARTVAPVVTRALPGIASGAATGAALGPWGALGGALVGGISSALGGGGSGHPPASAPARPPGFAPGPLPAQGAAAGSTSAIGQLLGALGSPTVQQALSSMLMGSAGARSVPAAGGSQIPVGAITNLLGMLASRASAEWESMVPSIEAESLDEGLDFAAPEVRSAWVFERLAPIEAATDESTHESVDESTDESADESTDESARESADESTDESADESTDEAVDESWIDAMYDELEMELASSDPEGVYDEADYEAFDESDGESFDEGAEPEGWSLMSYG